MLEFLFTNIGPDADTSVFVSFRSLDSGSIRIDPRLLLIGDSGSGILDEYVELSFFECLEFCADLGGVDGAGENDGTEIFARFDTVLMAVFAFAIMACMSSLLRVLL